MQSSNDSLSVLGPTMSGSPAVLLTPGRTRNIAQDMEALRLSRQDNPYLQQVMASRESLIESHREECVSDDTILMSQEFGSAALDFVEDDPLTLKEVHEHMIRSPPPTSCWPHDTISYRASSAFDFGAESPVSYSAYSVNSQEKELLGSRSPRRGTRCDDTRPQSGNSRARSSRSVSPRAHDLALCGRPLSLPGESHLRAALNKKQSNQQTDKFSILQHPRPLRRPHASRRGEDSVQLVQDCDK
ncbi:uncharacterized protein LOC123696897 isoform X1 [Colias croceus]|uniref:uncharacterized protein LOC123696897 isoform X1 n=1 Tax=Colias crocea TaxID=72248 RepID=UPI001E27B0A6|nr:uncharacterized protein LOC123696897 isoform X1 [Colias croceus]CAG4929077.1 unnamed protein product [Colias eurytheme]